jgi:deazaflavin-dependent oxidoreductase (nitroreductase family)
VATPNAYNDQVIEAFRARRGVVGGDFAGQHLLLLHHRSAKSGVDHVTPLLYWKVDATTVAVLASNYGAPRHPAWYHNLQANPMTTVEIGDAVWRVRARDAGPAERSGLLDLMRTTTAGVATAVNRTTRPIPVIVLERLTSADDEPGVTG